jgi:hypothetical protein
MKIPSSPKYFFISFFVFCQELYFFSKTKGIKDKQFDFKTLFFLTKKEIKEKRGFHDKPPC